MRSIQIIARILLISIVCCHAVSSGQLKRNDGNWWVGLSESNKTFYVGGMFDGVTLGRDFALRSFTEKNPTDPMIATILNGFDTTEKRLSESPIKKRASPGVVPFSRPHPQSRQRETGVVHCGKIRLHLTRGWHCPVTAVTRHYAVTSLIEAVQ
jgi:hypothetical protein